MLPLAAVFTSHNPLRPETSGLFSSSRLTCMRRHAGRAGKGGLNVNTVLYLLTIDYIGLYVIIYLTAINPYLY